MIEQFENGSGHDADETLTSAQMRAIEAAAIASGIVTGLELMERAGAGVVAAILSMWPGLRSVPGRVHILCGPGNNGGDGFVVARLLAARGWKVGVWLYGDPARLPPDAQENRRRWRALGPVDLLPFPVVPRGFTDSLPPDRRPGAGALVVDALFGIGLTRPADGVSALFDVFSPPDRRWHTVAIDVPSGIDADTGLPPPPPPGPVPSGAASFDADLTVTFHAPKPGHRTGGGRPPFGRVVVVDIGLQRATC